MVKQIKQLLNDNDGAETLEYIVIVSIILVLGVAAYNLNFADMLVTLFQKLSDAAAL